MRNPWINRSVVHSQKGLGMVELVILLLIFVVLLLIVFTVNNQSRKEAITSHFVDSYKEVLKSRGALHDDSTATTFYFAACEPAQRDHDYECVLETVQNSTRVGEQAYGHCAKDANHVDYCIHLDTDCKGKYQNCGYTKVVYQTTATKSGSLGVKLTSTYIIDKGPHQTFSERDLVDNPRPQIPK